MKPRLQSLPLAYLVALGFFCLLVVSVMSAGQCPAAEPAGQVPPGESRAHPTLTPLPPSSLVLADDDGWSIRKLWTGINNRARVVQLCVVVMCLALFILIKK